MREIKIRAWDDELKEMIYSKIEQFDDSLGFRFEKHFETETPIYMLWTTIPDANGKPMYDGDIVKGRDDDDNRIIGEVQYRVASFTVNGVKQYTFNQCKLNRQFEIIGNRYENPELLK